MLSGRGEQELERVRLRLASGGAAALLLVDAAPLGRIERQYGREASRRAMRGLVASVGELVAERFSGDESLVTMTPGGDEILAFVFRPRTDGRFYGGGLAQLARRISSDLPRSGARAVYPYYREPLVLPVGTAIVLYNPVLQPARQIRQLIAEARRDAELEASLDRRRRARRLLEILLLGRLDVRFEPIVDLGSGTAIGYEALARGPEGTDLHTPRQLFALAEESGLSFDLDCLCRRTALERAVGLPRGCKLFLNCLPTAIRDPGFREEGLRKTLEKLEIHPGDLVLEISEKESIENFSIFREMRDSYRELGIQIAIDDAGVGYASLEAIMEIAPDYVKADMALVRGIDSDPPRQEVVRALGAVAQRLGAQVIAEGIETPEELHAVQELGVRYGQGFGLSPAPLLGRNDD